MTLAPEEAAELRVLLERVADGELRRGLESLLVKQLKLSKARGR